MTHHLNKLVQSGQEKGFKVEQNVDYGAGPIDVVWNINLHSALPNIKCGFVTLGAEEEEGSQDTEDNQSPPYKCRAQVTAHFPIGRSFERHQNSVHREQQSI